MTMAMEASGSGAAARTCHFKLVLLGETAVGKSCLVVRFVRNEFFEYQEPTIGGESRAGGKRSCVCVSSLVCTTPS